LQLPRILSSQYLQSSRGNKIPVHDEHLFIVTHQTFELWFKQIIHEVDSVRQIFADAYLEERNMLLLISRITRVSDILQEIIKKKKKSLALTVMVFYQTLPYLQNGSGFQSLQFRLMEIKLGMTDELRVQYNQQHYMNVFFGEEKEKLKRAVSEKNLFELVNGWLERTPGLEANGFDFFDKFKCSVQAMHEEFKAFGEVDEDEKKEHLLEYKRGVENFDSIFDENKHNKMIAAGDRRFSHKALQGALMIYLYRDEPRFHLPFQLLHALMDIDSHLTKFRSRLINLTISMCFQTTHKRGQQNRYRSDLSRLIRGLNNNYITDSHTCMVQRMIGRKIGSGGSSGYLYLRSTCSDRYKIFVDLMNLSSFLVPRDRIPPLN
uniref:Tryptophan 2,3-dioxygenase n=1 Tax=Ciona savignyi TaxID=51511 RepID=H2YYY6_CIOSA